MLEWHPESSFTLGTHILFRNLGRQGTNITDTFDVRTKDNVTPLGRIKWFSRWRKYAFFPEPETVFEETCMTEIAEFCVEQTNRRYPARKYNKEFGDDKVCVCDDKLDNQHPGAGHHTYYRHFDWDNNHAVGCKYCGCDNFREKK